MTHIYVSLGVGLRLRSLGSVGAVEEAIQRAAQSGKRCYVLRRVSDTCTYTLASHIHTNTHRQYNSAKHAQTHRHRHTDTQTHKHTYTYTYTQTSHTETQKKNTETGTLTSSLRALPPGLELLLSLPGLQCARSGWNDGSAGGRLVD